jgi:hypothetical protein
MESMRGDTSRRVKVKSARSFEGHHHTVNDRRPFPSLLWSGPDGQPGGESLPVRSGAYPGAIGQLKCITVSPCFQGRWLTRRLR